MISSVYVFFLWSDGMPRIVISQCEIFTRGHFMGLMIQSSEFKVHEQRLLTLNNEHFELFRLIFFYTDIRFLTSNNKIWLIVS